MSEEATSTIITAVAQELLAKLDFQPEISVSQDSDARYRCDLRLAENQHFLIGQHGANLAALQHLMRALVRRRTDERFSLTVDVNGYMQEKQAQIEREAETACAEVERTGQAVSLRPMQAYERKMVHSFLAAHAALETESSGEGPERRIVIRPKSIQGA